jgi:hypothetical protein
LRAVSETRLQIFRWLHCGVCRDTYKLRGYRKLLRSVESGLQIQSYTFIMSKTKNILSKKNQNPVSQNQTTELKLVRLLQDDLEWDSNPIARVQTLFELFDTIDREEVLGSSVPVNDTEIDDRDEEALLQDLDKWLKDHSSSSTDESEKRDWLLSSKSTESSKSKEDSKGNRYARKL